MALTEKVVVASQGLSPQREPQTKRRPIVALTYIPSHGW